MARCLVVPRCSYPGKLTADAFPPCVAAVVCVQSQFSGQPMEVITKDTDRDFFMSPQEAIEYGLIDALVAKPQELQVRRR